MERAERRRTMLDILGIRPKIERKVNRLGNIFLQSFRRDISRRRTLRSGPWEDILIF